MAHLGHGQMADSQSIFGDNNERSLVEFIDDRGEVGEADLGERRGRAV